jgi:hypothetical protein
MVGAYGLAERGLLAEPLILAAVAGVFTILMMKISDLAPWSWTWRMKYNMYGWTHHTPHTSVEQIP